MAMPTFFDTNINAIGIQMIIVFQNTAKYGKPQKHAQAPLP